MLNTVEEMKKGDTQHKWDPEVEFAELNGGLAIHNGQRSSLTCFDNARRRNANADHVGAIARSLH